ncbi:homeobox-leucine zipper protein HAT22-like [Rhodamnia argentea]|uniref:Homeobox-leucine zipper protein HAT22-like n=1 Tax=Rhodamnia argentea TaxID=178133 RepID=A0A8B8PMI8_9MYRT|nr:homeobox-leucine zipper protein HAT22-like [Rhodamnia argentea]
MGDVEEACNTGLFLGLGVGGCATKRKEERKKKNRLNSTTSSSTVGLGLSFSIYCSSSKVETDDHPSNSINNTEYSTRSSFRNSFDQSQDDHNSPPRSSSNNAGDFSGGGRKKLRLTREQSALLEESFKLHTTLAPAQKQSLADQLKLKPRQVEVWFQNRRARSKLKQTEVDCEFLKKCCETLSDENRRLKRELQELRSCSPYVQAPKTAAVMLCPSCEILARGNSEATRKENCSI